MRIRRPRRPADGRAMVRTVDHRDGSIVSIVGAANPRGEQARFQRYDLQGPTRPAVGARPVTDDYFFSERESGVQPQVGEDLDEIAWGGVVALIQSQLASHSFALAFPVNCDDHGRGVIATHEDSFWLALRASVPETPLPLSDRRIPSTPAAMDVIEFIGKHVARATEADFHAVFRHRRLNFDEAAGLAALRREANLIFRRSGLAFAVEADGRVSRLPPAVIRGNGSSDPCQRPDDPRWISAWRGQLRSTGRRIPSNVAKRLRSFGTLGKRSRRCVAISRPESRRLSVR